VSWVPALGGWLVTAFAVGRDVLGRRHDFTIWAEPNLVRASLGVMMLTTDAEAHDRQRLPFDEPFRMRAVRKRFEAPEIAAQLRVILFGAIETVESMVLNSVLLLLEHPDQLAVVRAEPELLPNAIEEAMRLIPSVAFIERWTSTPTTLGNVELDRGEFVGVSTLAAGRDPEVFEDPLRFDVRRENARHHLAFSFGRHHCLGFNMARLQGAIALRGLIDGLPGLELVKAPEPTGFAFRKPADLHLRWRA
jgi:cytochrome P450